MARKTATKRGGKAAAETQVEWARMTAPEINAAMKKEPLIIVPVASMEQHGPHLAVAVDTLLCTEVAVRTARKLVARGLPTLVTPTIWTGLAEHHMSLGGTFTLDFRAFFAVIRGVVKSLVRHGAKRVMLMNGHGGNAQAVCVTATDLQAEFGIKVAAGTYWYVTGDVLKPHLERQNNLSHACEAETSMMMAIAPDRVRKNMIAKAHGPLSNRVPGQDPELFYRRPFKQIALSGVIGDARVASPEKGEKLFEAASSKLADQLGNAKLWA